MLLIICITLVFAQILGGLWGLRYAARNGWHPSNYAYAFFVWEHPFILVLWDAFCRLATRGVE